MIFPLTEPMPGADVTHPPFFVSQATLGITARDL